MTDPSFILTNPAEVKVGMGNRILGNADQILLR